VAEPPRPADESAGTEALVTEVSSKLDPSGPNSAPGPCPQEASRSCWQASCTRRCDLVVTAY
jgi:hypothetical protein